MCCRGRESPLSRTRAHHPSVHQPRGTWVEMIAVSRQAEVTMVLDPGSWKMEEESQEPGRGTTSQNVTVYPRLSHYRAPGRGGLGSRRHI